MIPQRRGLVTFIALLVVIALLWLFAYIWAGHSLSNLHLLTSLTHQKVEELLGEAIGQKVQIGTVSVLSSNRLSLEDVASGQYLSGDSQEKLPLSFHVRRMVIAVNLWRYFWDGKVSSIQVQLDQPDVRLDGAIGVPELKESPTAKGVLPVDLVDVDLQIVIKKGRLSYVDTATKETISVEPIEGAIEIKTLAGGEPAVQQICIAPLEVGLGPTRLRLEGRITVSSKIEGNFTLGPMENQGVSVGEITGSMKTDGRDFTFHDLQGSILGASITGQGRLIAGGKPHYDLHLVVNGIKPTGVGIITKAWQLDLPPIALKLLSDMYAEVRILSTRTGPKLDVEWHTYWQGHKVTGKGVLNPDRTYKVEAYSIDISLGELLEQFSLSLGEMSVGGTVDVTYALDGTWGQKSHSSVKAHIEELVVDDMPLGQANLGGIIDGNQFVVNEAKWDTGAGSITFGGKINWGESLDVWMKAPELQMQNLPWLSREVQNLQGTLAVKGTWQGSWLHPVWLADFDGHDINWVTTGVPGSITVPRVNGEIQGWSIELFPFDLHYGSGIVTVAGTVLLEEPAHPVLDMKGTVKEVGCDLDSLAGRLSGTIFLSGGWPNPSLSGQLRLHQGRLDLVKLGRTNTPAVDLDMPLDLEINIDEDLVVTGAGLVDVVAGGTLQINGSVANPEIKGRVDALRGQLVYLGTPFQMVRGWAEFRPYGERSPDLYLEGSAMVKGLPVTLILQGSGTELKPTLQSDQGFSERELLAMLSVPEKINTALDDGLGQVFQREMRELLAGQFRLHVLGGLERRLQKMLGLDQLQLEPGLSDGEARLELGKYVTKDVFVAYTQTVYPHFDNQWHMDYKLDHGLRLSTTWNGDGHYRLGIEVKVDF